MIANVSDYDCSRPVQTLRDRDTAFSFGSSNWYVPATIEYSDQPGQWTYCASIDGDVLCNEFTISGGGGYPPPPPQRPAPVPPVPPVPPQGCPGTIINRGQTLRGYIASYDDSDTYCFYDFIDFGTLTVRMNRESSTLDPFLMVYDDHGRLVHDPYADEDRGGWPNALVSLWQWGTESRYYRIVATRYPGQGSYGSYAIRVDW